MREQRTLVQGQRSAELSRQAVFEDEAGLHIRAVGEGEEFRGARVDVRFIHAARVHEAGGHGDAEIDERGEGLAVCQVTLSACAFAAAGVGVRARVEVVFEPGVGGALGLEDGETVFARRGELEFGVEVCGDGWVGWWYR